MPPLDAPARLAPPATAGHRPRVAFLRSISVEGFRGFGPKATLDLTPGPGLTLVVGRNGSGKSSFAEALELLLTGETYRWENRSKVWRDGWRNLHHPKAAVAADFALEGEKGACTVAREWADKAELDAATTWAQVHGKPRGGQEALGWDTPLAAYRPFLSYNELGSMLDEGPSKLYDALSKVLGLDDLVDAQNTLQQARATRDSAQKDADKERKALLAQLETLSDERATRAKEALAQKDWGIGELETILAGSGAVAEKDSGLEILKRLCVLPSPDAEAIAASVKALREAAERQAQAAQTVAGKSDDLASLLDHALRFHQAHGDGDCPVCGSKNALDKGWHQTKAKEAETLRQAARDASEARQATKARMAEARKLLAIDHELLKKANAAGIEELAQNVLSHAQQALPQTTEETPQAATQLADAIEREAGQLVIQLDQLKQAATQALEARQDAWRPHATAHDDRLPEAVRRLGIKATVIEVTRKEGSLVAPRPSKDPVSRYIEDAMALAKTNDLPKEVARRVVPGLCRQAIEAACMEAIRRRRIGRGEPHADVEDLLAGLTGTRSIAALALFDDKDRAGEVLTRLNKENKTWADTFRAVNEGSHEAFPGDVVGLVSSAKNLARWMQGLA